MEWNRTVRFAALLTAVATAWAVQEAPAQQFIPKIFTHNKYNDNAVWVTIYDLGKLRHLDYGCMAKGGGVRTWTSGDYAFGSYYYVRAFLGDEPKSPASAGLFFRDRRVVRARGGRARGSGSRSRGLPRGECG